MARDRLDAHCHFWSPARGDYGWMDAGGPALAPLRLDFGPADLAALNGGGDVIVVQAAPSLAETRHLLALAAAFPQIRGVVGWADLAAPDAPADIADLARDPLLVGLRPMLQDLAEDDWIARRPTLAAMAAVTRAGLRFDALVLPRHLPHLWDFARRNPDLAIVVDHAAKPRLAQGHDADWAAGMARLARDPRIHCKLSGLLTEMSPEQRRTPDNALTVLRPVFGHLLDWFGTDRLIWGSDWPVLTLAAGHGDWLSLTDALLDGLTRDERAAILGGNGRRFYGVAS